jgi:hypothetical protein
VNNFDFEKQTRSQVIEILRRHAADVVQFEIATDEQDTKQATDFVVKTTIGRIAVRVRRNIKYRDLTIRTRAMYGGRTEIDKLRDGWGDMFLYCWQDSNNDLSEYMLVDIHKMRQVGMLEESYMMHLPEISNNDGTWFCPFPFDSLYGAGCIKVHTVKDKPGQLHRASLPTVLRAVEMLNEQLLPLRRTGTGN